MDAMVGRGLSTRQRDGKGVTGLASNVAQDDPEALLFLLPRGEHVEVLVTRGGEVVKPIAGQDRPQLLHAGV